MKKLAYIALAVLLSASCKEHRPYDQVVPDTGNAEVSEKQEPKYKGLRVYSGTIPCADCSGIEQQLVLKGDSMGVYRLKEVYKDATEDGDSELISTGEWKFVRSGSDYVYYLSEKNLRDSIRVIRYRLDRSEIVMLDMKGDSIHSANSYRLRLVSKAK